MKVLGIDPGLIGGLCVLDGTDVLLVTDLPVHLVSVGHRKTTRPELDLHGLHALIAEHAPLGHAYVEKIAARPKQGTVSTFRFGTAYGGILGVLAAMAVPLSLVPPRNWQRWAGCGPSGDSARQRAVQLFPELADRLARVKDAHRADALLLAAYGARAHMKDAASPFAA